MNPHTAIINAKIWTGATHVPAGVDAIMIKNEMIAAVGNTDDILSLRDSNTEVIDARGAFLIPGFTDCHCHFLDGGLRLLSVKLRDVKSVDEFCRRIQEKTETMPKGSWILGGDWDHHAWGGTLPSKTWIDAVSPHHPVWVNRMDGHMALANSKALAFASISRETRDVPGGEIVRDAYGEPTGVLKDNAQNLVVEKLPKRETSENERALAAAMDYVAARGVTKVHTMVTVECACGLWPRNLGRDAENEDMERAFEELSVYRTAHRARALKTRIRAALPLASWRRLLTDLQQNGAGDDWLQLGCLKAMIDGSLGSHTAAMLKDYDDTPGFRGHLIWEPEILERHVREASMAGMQVMVHAIGDYAVREQLDIFERVARQVPGRDARFRIEHAQHIAPEDIKRFGAQNVIASLQMSHLADDGRWATNAIGRQRLRSSWPMASLIATGAVVALGSDWFVTEPSPLEGIYAAVTRRTNDGRNPDGLVPEEKVSVADALRGYTSGAAYAAFEEHRRGSIEPGKLADLVILDRDLLAIPVDEIPHARIVRTIVGGTTVFQDGVSPSVG